MVKFVMKGASPLVVFHEGSLKTFAPGAVIDASEAPHEWFELVDPPKVTPAPKPVVKKKLSEKKEHSPKVKLPADKF